jgi:uroporphyrinogen decarboxylase
VLVRGTPADVRAEVKLRIAQLAPGGGYILDASQGYTEDVPLANIVALFEAALDYGQY